MTRLSGRFWSRIIANRPIPEFCCELTPERSLALSKFVFRLHLVWLSVSCLVRALRSESLCPFGCEAVGQNGACPSLPSLLIPLQVKEDCIYLLPVGVDSVVEAGSAVVVAGHVFAALHFFGTALRRGALCPPRRRPVVVAFRRTLLLGSLGSRAGAVV